MKKFLLGIAFALMAGSSFAQVSLKMEPASVTLKPGEYQVIKVSVAGAALNAYEAMQLVITIPVGMELGGTYVNYDDLQKLYEEECEEEEIEPTEEGWQAYLKENGSYIRGLFPSTKKAQRSNWQVLTNFTKAPFDYYQKDPDSNQDVFWRTSTTNELNVVIMNQASLAFPGKEVAEEPLFEFSLIATDRCYTGTQPVDINYVTFTTPDKQSVPISDATVGDITYAIDYTIPTCGYGTLVWPLALDMSSNDFTVNTGEFPEAGKPQYYVIPVPVEGKKIAGNEPVIIIGKAGTYSLNTLPKDQSESVSKVKDNVLEGTVDAPLKVTGSNIFALSEKNGVVGFYRCNEGVEIPQYKAYLTGNASVDAYLFEADGINNVVAGELDGDAYTISGVKVNKTNKKGVYIVNGKKVVVK